MRVWTFACLAMALAFLACDALWLSVMAGRLYRPYLGGLLKADFDLAPAMAFYGLYFLGIAVFAVAPARALGSWPAAAWRGALLGLVAYGTYDLTNQATLRDWPLAITLADLCWGTVLTGFAATVGFIAARRAPGAASTQG